MKINVITCADHVSPESVKGNTAVVVDTLRATSVIITAISHGAKSVVPMTSVEEALETKKKLENVVLGGERKARLIDGFDLSNSPKEYTASAVAEKNVVLTTTNGTKAIARSSSATRIFIGALRNARAVAEAAVAEERDAVIVNAGTGGEFSMDDFITAGAIIAHMLELKPAELTDVAKTALIIYETHRDLRSYIQEAHHYGVLEELGLSEDLDFCLQESVEDIVPEYKNGIIKQHF